MKQKMKTVLVLVCMSLIIFPVSSQLWAGDSLKPLLIDLNGWQAEPPDAMNMEMSGMKMIQASRSYTMGDSNAMATILVTSEQMGMAAMPEMSMTQGSVKVEAGERDGFKVVQTHDSSENAGNIMVLLGEDEGMAAMFTIGYEGLSGQDGYALAEKFDWQKMQKETAALLK